MLLLLEIDSKETRAILPGKLYEYMMAERPVLAIGPKGSDIEQLLKESGSGSYFAYGDMNTNNLCLYFEAAYAKFKKGELNLGQTQIRSFERRALADQLATLLKKRNPRKD